MMEDTAFHRMVADYEHSSRHHPRRFAWTTATWAALGYAALCGALLVASLALYWALSLILAGRFSVGTAFLALSGASLLWSLLSAMWTRQQLPQGIVLKPTDAPRLFDLIEKVRRRCGAPRPDVVMIDGELNAALLQQPRLGLLGWHRNHLIIGLPLLMALDTRQLAAVLAHEFGHLQGAHGKVSAWVYRTRRSWWLLAKSREHSPVNTVWADAALALFFRHFFPRFNARAFVLSRQQEYEADATAHRAVGTRAAAESLLSINVQALYLDQHFWPGVFQAAKSSATPGARPYRAMARQLKAALAHPHATRWLRDALKQLPNAEDTHPSLRERIDFSGEPAHLPGPPAQSAAEALLQEAAVPLIHQMDERWQRETAEQWHAIHRHHRVQSQLVQDLSAERERGPINPDDHLLWASAARETDGSDSETQVLRQLLADHPDHSEARYRLGMTLVDKETKAEQEEGTAMLRNLALQGGSQWALPAARRYERQLIATEAFGQLKPWRDRLRQLESRNDEAWESLNDFEGPLQFCSPGFGKRVLRPLTDALRRKPAVGRAFLVQKVSPYAPGWRLCLLVIERSKGLLGQPDAQDWWSEIEEQIALPCATRVLDLAHPYWADAAQAGVVRQITETPGALVYSGRRL